MSKRFRVLIIDDKKTVLKAVDDLIEHNFRVGEEDFTIELLSLHVEVIEEKAQYKLSNKTIENLYEFCDKPFNLVLIDYGYVKQDLDAIGEIFKLKELNPNKSLREIIDEVVLNPSHLITQSFNTKKYYKKINKYFIEFSGAIYIYTWIPSKIEQDYTSADVRKNVTDKQFPRARINIIDTRKELFNNAKFEDKHSKEYYSFLISKFLSKIVHIEIAESSLLKSKGLKEKLLKIKRNNRILASSAVITSFIAGVFIPTIIKSFKSGENVIYAGAFFITIIILFFVLIIGRKIIDNQNSRLIK